MISRKGERGLPFPFTREHLDCGSSLLRGETTPRVPRRRRIASKHPLLLSAAITTTVLGFITGLGGVIALLLAEGHASSETDLARYGRRYRAARGASYVWRTQVYIRGSSSLERSVDFEFTMSSVMAALRLKSWKTDAHWRRVFVLVAGSLATLIGGLALLLVLSRPEGRPTVIAWIAVVSVSLAVSFAR
jgi:hypothetical protein